MKQLNKLVRHDLVRGLKDVTFEKDRPCSACQAGKQHGRPHPRKNEMSTSRAFELLHMDLFGPTTYSSIGGNKYGFMIVDDYTRYTWVFFLYDKSEVYDLFYSNHLSRGCKISLRPPSRRLEVIMEVSSRTQELKICVMSLALGNNSHQPTLPIPMV